MCGQRTERKGLRIVRDKRPTKQIVHDANDVIRSGNIPSSMGETVDEPSDRYMEFSGQIIHSNNISPSSDINCYRLDYMYKAIDY